MVECSSDLDLIFGSLADPTRRDILRRGAGEELSIGEIAEPYDLSLAAISKHIGVLEKAKLVMRHRQGKQQLVRLLPQGFTDAAEYLRSHERMWNDRLDSLERYLSSFPPSSHGT